MAAGLWPELRTQAYIAYKVQPVPVGLIITPASEAVASGGAEVSFRKDAFPLLLDRRLGFHLVGARPDLCAGFAGRKRDAAIMRGLPFHDEGPRSK